MSKKIYRLMFNAHVRERGEQSSFQTKSINKQIDNNKDISTSENYIWVFFFFYSKRFMAKCSQREGKVRD